MALPSDGIDLDENLLTTCSTIEAKEIAVITAAEVLQILAWAGSKSNKTVEQLTDFLLRYGTNGTVLSPEPHPRPNPSA